MQTKTLKLIVIAVILIVLATAPAMAWVANAQEANKGQAKIAEQAFIYGFPMVMNYGVFYQYFIDKSAPRYKLRSIRSRIRRRCSRYKDTASLPPTATRLTRSSAWICGQSPS